MYYYSHGEGLLPSPLPGNLIDMRTFQPKCVWLQVMFLASMKMSAWIISPFNKYHVCENVRKTSCSIETV